MQISCQKIFFFYFLIISPPLWIEFIPEGVCLNTRRWQVGNLTGSVRTFVDSLDGEMATEASQNCAGKQANSRYKYLRPNGLVSRCKFWHFACCLVTVLAWSEYFDRSQISVNLRAFCDLREFRLTSTWQLLNQRFRFSGLTCIPHYVKMWKAKCVDCIDLRCSHAAYTFPQQHRSRIKFPHW